MRTSIAAALALATVASAHAAPLDHIAWRTQQGFEQAYREGVQYGYQHDSAFFSNQGCNSEECAIAMQYTVDDERYTFLTWLGSNDRRGNQICVEHRDGHRTCANDNGDVGTKRKIEADW
jgi:hypothetical protein